MPHRPSPGTSMVLPLPPPPGLVHPSSFTQTPATTQAPATTQQSRPSTEGSAFLPSATFGSTDMDLQVAASSTSLLYCRKRRMKGPGVNQSSLAKESKVVALAHLIFSALSSRYFSRSFFACFLNLVTHTLVYFFHCSSVILVFHLAFMLSTCYPINDSNELL